MSPTNTLRDEDQGGVRGGPGLLEIQRGNNEHKSRVIMVEIRFS